MKCEHRKNVAGVDAPFYFRSLAPFRSSNLPCTRRQVRAQSALLICVPASQSFIQSATVSAAGFLPVLAYAAGSWNSDAPMEARCADQSFTPDDTTLAGRTSRTASHHVPRSLWSPAEEVARSQSDVVGCLVAIQLRVRAAASLSDGLSPGPDCTANEMGNLYHAPVLGSGR